MTGYERILVVRLGAMGDIIHTLPAVARLRQSFPTAQIVWAVEAKWSALLEKNPAIDALQLVRRTFSDVVQLRQNLHRAGISIAIDFQGLIKSAVVCSFARPNRIIGLHRKAAREALASLFYSRTVIPKAAHVVDRQLELAAAAGATSSQLVFPIPEGKSEGYLPERPFVIANPLAGWISKQWPLEYYSEIGARLRRLGMELVLNGPAAIEAPCCIPHASGLPGLIHASRRATAVLGVDSGPLHLAAALGKRGVAVYGPTDPARNGPYGGTMRVLRKQNANTSYKRGHSIDPSMRAVTPDEVWSALREQL